MEKGKGGGFVGDGGGGEEKVGVFRFGKVGCSGRLRDGFLGSEREKRWPSVKKDVGFRWFFFFWAEDG